jgi:hypothetical protein
MPEGIVKVRRRIACELRMIGAASSMRRAAADPEPLGLEPATEKEPEVRPLSGLSGGRANGVWLSASRSLSRTVEAWKSSRVAVSGAAPLDAWEGAEAADEGLTWPLPNHATVGEGSSTAAPAMTTWPGS